MMRALILGLGLFFISSQTWAGLAWPPDRERGFHPGEKLKFIIKYQFVGAGTATMEITEGATIQGRPTIRYETKAQSNNFIDSFFKVRDFNASTVDKATLTSLGFHQNLKEGKYKVMRTTVMDYGTNTYTFEKIYKGKTTQRAGPLEDHMQDILSSFFYARTLPLELGKEYTVTVFSDGDVYPLKIKVGPKLQKISVPAGKFECIKIEPNVSGDAIFKTEDGKMTIWLSNDEKRTPVLIRSKVFIGAVDAELMEIQ